MIRSPGQCYFAMSTYIFQGRKLVIATQHGKEQVLAPVLKGLGAEIFVAGDLDTDQFGTFSGEIERMVDPLEAARLKCAFACQQYNCTLAVASEGSFGPHPNMFFVPADDEILVFLDLAHNLEIKAREISTKTNFAGRQCHTWEEVQHFATTALFPQHALIIRKAKDEMWGIVKGLNDWQCLEKAARDLLLVHGSLFVETDMRAMYNPSRMKVIEQAAIKLLSTIQRLCPKCSMPGFDVADVRPGLPCGQCGAPTRSTLAWIYQCQKCRHQQGQRFPKGKQKEDPMYCDWCNP